VAHASSCAAIGKWVCSAVALTVAVERIAKVGTLSGKVLSAANGALSLPRSRHSRTRAACCLGVLLISSGLLANAQMKKAYETGPSTAANEIIAREIALQKSEIDLNFAALEKLMVPEYFELSQSFMNRDQVFAMLRRVSESGCRVQPVKMKDARVTFLSPDVATVVYRATQTGTCYSRTFSVDANISTLWVQRDGRWQAEMHSELLAGS
jgi:hypothetical protein